MSKIHLLSEIISNRIAAGEVVERPASIIKELVENSVDAGATSIAISIVDGGIKRIRVTDNGGGIAKEDFPLTVVKHATSKILTLSDLNSIESMGFRGEALASICAVSKITIKSRTRNAISGNELHAAGGKVEYIKDAGLPEGTSVTVDELFFNTPVRLKFLKKPASETAVITDLVGRLILAYPSISIRYSANDREVFHSPGSGDLTDAVLAVFGSSIRPHLIPIDFAYRGLRIGGLIGRPQLSFKSSKNGSVFVNSRYIKSPAIQSAIMGAYGERLLKGAYPFYAVFINMDASEIDVNVHPNKMQVHFSDENAVVFAVSAAVGEALRSDISTPVFDISDSRKNKGTDTAESSLSSLHSKGSVQLDIPARYDDGFRKEIKIQQRAFSSLQKFEHNDEKDKNNSEKNAAFPAAVVEPDAASKQTDITAAVIDSEPESVPEREQVMPIHELRQSGTPYKVLGAAFSAYLMVESGDTLYLIDQHAAHERMIYDALIEGYRRGGAAIQAIIPEEIVLTAEDIEIIDENLELFQRLGLKLSKSGDMSYSISAVPQIMGYIEPKRVMEDILENIRSGRMEASAEIRLPRIAKAACKSAIKAGYRLSESEIHAVVDDLQSLETIPNCPHGRPIAIAIRRQDIEKAFKRRQ